MAPGSALNHVGITKFMTYSGTLKEHIYHHYQFVENPIGLDMEQERHQLVIEINISLL